MPPWLQVSWGPLEFRKVKIRCMPKKEGLAWACLDETKSQRDEVNCTGSHLQSAAEAGLELNLCELHSLCTNLQPISSVHLSHSKAACASITKTVFPTHHAHSHHNISKGSISKLLTLRCLPGPLTQKYLLLVGSQNSTNHLPQSSFPSVLWWYVKGYLFLLDSNLSESGSPFSFIFVFSLSFHCAFSIQNWFLRYFEARWLCEFTLQALPLL